MIAQVRPRDLQAWFASTGATGAPVLLDVREPIELRAASVAPGDYTLVTMPMASIPGRLAELDPRQPVACLCHHGGRSMQVANFLRGRGFTHVANVAGGIHAWADEVDAGVARY
jgi:rhodanese-related sulfurtransferase